MRWGRPGHRGSWKPGGDGRLGRGHGQLVRRMGLGPGRPENRPLDLAVWREVLGESWEQDLTWGGLERGLGSPGHPHTSGF